MQTVSEKKIICLVSNNDIVQYSGKNNTKQPIKILTNVCPSSLRRDLK